jgi:hypothetical protein
MNLSLLATPGKTRSDEATFHYSAGTSAALHFCCTCARVDGYLADLSHLTAAGAPLDLSDHEPGVEGPGCEGASG